MRAEIARLNSEDRRDERFVASADAEVRGADAQIYPAVLMDVSQRGFRAMVDGHLAAQSLIAIRVERMKPLRARVVWVNGTVLGCEFLEGLSQTALIALLRRRISQERHHPEDMSR